MTPTETFRACLRHYADRNIDAIAAMFADDITLRDWNICVVGKAAVVAETALNFAAAQSIEIHVQHLYQGTDAVAGELKIILDGKTELFVVDVMTFNAEGRIRSIRAYLGRADDPVAGPGCMKHVGLCLLTGKIG